MAELEDRQIVELFMNRDESALDRTAEKYGPRLRALAKGILGDERDAAECENDAYLNAWRSIPPNDPSEHLFAYLARIVRRLALDERRRKGRLKRSAVVTELTLELEECLPSGGDAETEAEARLLGDAISRWLRSQPRERADIFVRRYWYCDSVSEVARGLGVSESKVKSALARSRAALRKYLIEEGYDI